MSDAENNQISKEDKVPVGDFYCSYVPRVTGWLSCIRRPNVPEAQDNHATRASGMTKMSSGCVSGRKSGGALRSFRAKKKLWMVSSDTVS
jgi:hypothetical protein